MAKHGPEGHLEDPGWPWGLLGNLSGAQRVPVGQADACFSDREAFCQVIFRFKGRCRLARYRNLWRRRLKELRLKRSRFGKFTRRPDGKPIFGLGVSLQVSLEDHPQGRFRGGEPACGFRTWGVSRIVCYTFTHVEVRGLGEVNDT